VSGIDPFTLLFGAFRAEHFPRIRAALGERTDVDAFMLAAPALDLLRELRPDEGLGEGVDNFVALVHAAYLFWRDGEALSVLDERATRECCGATPAANQTMSSRSTLPISKYVQLAPHIVWGQLDDDAPFEPLDGWFAVPGRDDALRMVACFGVHPQRPGVSVVVLEGSLPIGVARPDGTALFAPLMPGGNAASLFAVNSPDELLLLGWRGTFAERGS
jgi:hypothetical protein